jgi:pyruvate formate lyase activating enzyme
LRLLGKTAIPFVIRIPLVPGITDTEENLSAIARLASPLKGLQRVDLLPYNRAAGGKYEAAGMAYRPGFDEEREVRTNTGPFERMGLEVRIT